MSPEQAEGRWDALGPVSDVFGLGATLYALLTGQAPYRGRDLTEVLWKARRGEFPAPRQVKRQVPRPLEAACLKAMAFAPADRYGSALELASDVEKWLADERVTAYREPWALRLGRWARRHKPLVAAAVSLLFTATVALAVSTYVVAEARDRAEVARQEEEKAKTQALGAEGRATNAARQAREAEGKAKEKGDQAEQVAQFLIGLFETSDPIGLRGYAYHTPQEKGPTLTAREILDHGSRKVVAELQGQPLVQATLLDTIGNVYRSLGMYDRAAAPLQAAYDLRRHERGDDHPDVAASLHNLGWLRHDQGDYEAAKAHYLQALALRLKHFGPESEPVAATEFNLAWALTENGEHDEAEPLFLDVIRIREKLPGGKDRRDVAIAQLGMAGLRLDQGRYLEALPYSQEAMRVFQQLEGDHGPAEPVGLFQQAVYLKGVGKHQKAEDVLEQCVEATRRLLGPDHPLYAAVVHEWADAAERLDHLGEAEERFRLCLDVAERSVGFAHPRVGVAVWNFADVLVRRGRPQDAEALFVKMLAARRERFGPGHVTYAEALGEYGNFLRRQGDPARALPLHREALAILRRKKAERHRMFPLFCAQVGLGLCDTGRPAEGEPYLREALPLARQKWARSPKDVAYLLGEMGGCLTDQKRYAQAVPYFEEAEAVQAGQDRAAWRWRQDAALARWWGGDAAAYRNLCATVRKESSGKEDPALASALAWILVLGDDKEGRDQALALAERAARASETGPFGLLCHGTALYRAGRWDQAAERLEKAVEAHAENGSAYEWLFLAMAYRRQGKEEAARAALDRADCWMSLVNEPDPGAVRRIGWRDRLQLGLLFREAEALAAGG
jgi:tetratricopeptide (TPR) repeat protein